MATIEAIIIDRTLVHRAIRTAVIAAVPATDHAAMAFGGIGSSQSPVSDMLTIIVANTTMHRLTTAQVNHASRDRARRAAESSGGTAGRGRGRSSRRKRTGLPCTTLGSVQASRRSLQDPLRGADGETPNSRSSSLDRWEYFERPQQRLQRKRRHCCNLDPSGPGAPRNEQGQRRSERRDAPRNRRMWRDRIIPVADQYASDEQSCCKNNDDA